MDIGYCRSGTLIVARDAGEAENLRKRATAGSDLSFLSADETRALEPLLAGDIAGTLLDASEAQVDSRALGPALAMEANE